MGVALALGAGVDTEDGVEMDAMMDERETEAMMEVASDTDADGEGEGAVDDAEDGSEMGTLDWNAVNAQLPPQVAVLSPAQSMLQLDASSATPAPFSKECPPNYSISIVSHTVS